MKRKVTFVVPSLRGGGAERVMTNLIRNIDTRKYEVELIAIKFEGPFTSLIPQGVNVIDLDTTNVRNSIIKLTKVLKKSRPNVIFTTLAHLNAIILIIKPFLSNRPKVIIREASTPSMNLSNMNVINRIIFSNIYKHLYPRADLIVAQCEEMKKDIKDTMKTDKNNLIHIYNPVDVEDIHAKMNLFDPYNNENLNIVAVGRLNYAKGYDILLYSLKKILDTIPNAKLTIVGSGELEKELKELVKSLNLVDYVDFIEFQNNPYPYIYYADIFVLSSRWEGFPNALVEALACNAKVVATDIKSGPREIIGDNEYGTLVNSNDPDELANGILKAINEENRSKGRGNHFDIKKIVKKYEEIFDI